MTRWVDDIVTVDEDAIADAMVLLMDRAKLYVEGAGAVGVAALMAGEVRPGRRGTTCVVVSGGNVDLGVLPGLIRRHENMMGRRLSIVARIDDRPGSLAKLLAVFADGNADLIEVEHIREGLDLHVRETGIHATFEVRSAEQARSLVESARAAGYDIEATRRTPNSPPRDWIFYLLVGRLGGVNESEILHELTPVAEALLERHLATSKEWFPHDYVPYGRGRDHDSATPWSEADADLGGFEIDPEVRSALLVNLLTEDNLPYYFRSVERMFGEDGAWGTWIRRWTAEEGRHAMVIHDYLMITRAIDPVELERARMAQVSARPDPRPDRSHDGFVYLALQELATRIAHRNTGALLGDPVGYEVMKRVGGRREPAPPLLPRPRRGGDRGRPDRR